MLTLSLSHMILIAYDTLSTMLILSLIAGAYDRAIKYVLERQQFDRSIASFQLVQERMMRVLGTLQAGILSIINLGRLMDQVRSINILFIKSYYYYSYYYINYTTDASPTACMISTVVCTIVVDDIMCVNVVFISSILVSSILVFILSCLYILGRSHDGPYCPIESMDY